MTHRSVVVLGFLWMASLVGTAAVAQSRMIARTLPASVHVVAGSTIQTAPPAQVPAPVPPPQAKPDKPSEPHGPSSILTGADMGFRVEGPGPAGTLMIKLNGRWVEAEFARPRVKLVR